jgi:D-alanine-D-alanine ligase
MHVGITYDLRESYLQAGYGDEETAEFDSLETIQALTTVLHDLGHSPEPIGNVIQLVQRLAAGDRWDLVFNIAEGLQGFGREAQVPALLDAYGIPYTFSDPLVLSLALHKGMAKHVVRGCGVPTADFAVIESLADLGGLTLTYPLFAKPVAEGTSKGISAVSRVGSLAELRSVCRRLLARFRQPVLVETFLPGREFTVGITGTGRKAVIVGVMEVLLGPAAERDAYSYHNKEHYQGLVEYRLVEGDLADKVGEIARSAWRSLSCRDGGRVDLRLDASGGPHFIEVNPLAGLHPTRSDLVILSRLAGISYHELIRRILESAARRQTPQDWRTAAPQRWVV